MRSKIRWRKIVKELREEGGGPRRQTAEKGAAAALNVRCTGLVQNVQTLCCM